MIQHLIIFLVFIAAAFYVGRLIYSQFTAKSGCAKGCGSACSTINLEQIEQKIKASARV
jgi:hypothetical protein